MAKLLKYGLNPTLMHFHNVYWIWGSGSHMSTPENTRLAPWKSQNQSHFPNPTAGLCGIAAAAAAPLGWRGWKSQGKLLSFQTSDLSYQHYSITFSPPRWLSQDLLQVSWILTSDSERSTHRDAEWRLRPTEPESCCWSCVFGQKVNTKWGKTK